MWRCLNFNKLICSCRLRSAGLLRWWQNLFSRSCKETFYKVTNMIWCCWICWKTNCFIIYCLDLSNLFDDGYIVLVFFIRILLSLQAVMNRILLYFSVSYWQETASMTCCTEFGYFIPRMRIQKLILSLEGNSLFREIILFYWGI